MTIVTARTAASPLTDAGRRMLDATEAEYRAAASYEADVYDADLYARTQHVLMLGLAAAYGQDAGDVYDAMVDSWESHSYCAATVAERKVWEARDAARSAFEDAAWNEIVDGLRPAMVAPLDMDDAYAVASTLVAESARAWDDAVANGARWLARTDADLTRPLDADTLAALPAPVAVALPADVVATAA